MVRARRGASKLGCLVTLLLVATIAYFGMNVGEVFLRYYRFRDAMTQEARFARQNPDDAIRTHLRARADSLGLPDEAGDVTVHRSANRITISSEYHESVEFPMYVRVLRFAPTVTEEL